MKNCFITNPQQVRCIADMVINKAAAVSSVLELALEEGESEHSRVLFSRATHELAELINWVKYLQIVREIGLFRELMKERQDERRKEKRYPLPEPYYPYLTLRVGGQGGGKVPCTLLDFSRHGLSFRCAQELHRERDYQCEFSIVHVISKTMTFPAVVRYCRLQGQEYVIGAEIGDVPDQDSFNFFSGVIDAIVSLFGKAGRT